METVEELLQFVSLDQPAETGLKQGGQQEEAIHPHRGN